MTQETHAQSGETVQVLLKRDLTFKICLGWCTVQEPTNRPIVVGQVFAQWQHGWRTIRMMCGLSLLFILMAGCVPVISPATTGNKAIKDARAEDLRGQTKSQLIERYGAPTMRSMAYKDDHASETLVWVYVVVSGGKVDSTSIGVTFDEAGTVSRIDMTGR